MQERIRLKNMTKDQIADFLQNSYNLYVRCIEDKKDLIRGNLDWRRVELIPVLVKECTFMEAHYNDFLWNREKIRKSFLHEYQQTRIKTAILLEIMRSKFKAESIDISVPSIRNYKKKEDFFQLLAIVSMLGDLHGNLFIKSVRDDICLIKKLAKTLPELYSDYKLTFVSRDKPHLARKKGLFDLSNHCQNLKNDVYEILRNDKTRSVFYKKWYLL